MSLIDLIEKLITEHGSAAILKEHLDLLRSQISALEKENSALKSENASLKSKESAIESHLNKGEEEIKRLNQVIEGLKNAGTKTHLNEVAEKILNVFFDVGRGLSFNEVAAFFSMDINTVKYYFDLLLESDLIERTTVGFVAPRNRAPVLFELTPSGRKYVVENILK